MTRKTTRYMREVRERAVSLVLGHQDKYDSQWDAIRSVAGKVNVSTETLRKWVRQAETDAGERPGVGGRIVLDQVIHDNLDVGRPDHIGLVFGRRIFTRGPRPTSGSFRTRVLTVGERPRV